VDDGGLPEGIDERWVTDALSDCGLAGGANVTAVELGGWIGTGQAARTARLGLTCDRAAGLPSTVVVKLPSADPMTRSVLFATGSYLKEWVFYDQLAANVWARVPACYRAEWHPDAQEFALLMEDLAGSQQGDQLVGLAPDELALALEQAAALHGPRWGDPTLESAFPVDGNPIPTMAGLAPLLQAYYQGSVPQFLERLGDRLDAEVVRTIEDFGPHVADWLTADLPHSLVHHDLRADNLLFAASPEADPVALVDWQTVGAAPAADDVAYLISTSCPSRAERAAVERDLLEEYRSRLAAWGVDPGPDELWHQYRHGSLYGLLITVIATLQAERTERGDAALSAMAQRTAWQAIDLEALSLVA